MKIGNEDLQVNRPHYISRYDRPTPKNAHCCSKECLGTKLRVGPQKAGFQRSAQQKKQKSRQFRQKVARIRQQLLAMLAQNKVQLQIDVIMKRLAATRQKQSHGRVLAEVRAQLQTLKREVYLLYKHTCSNRKDRLCLNCQQRQHYFRTRVLSFLQQRKRDSSISNHPNQEPNTSSRSHSSDASQKRSPQGHEPKALVDSSNYQSLKWSRPSKRETKSARFSGFRINREAEKLKTTREKIGESPAVQQNQTNNAYAKDRKNSRKYSAFRSLQSNAESSKALNQKIPPESEDCGSELSQSNELRESHNPKRIMRKSVKLESEGKTAEPQGSPKSKFYNMSKEQKGRKTTEMRPSMGCDPKSLEKNGQGGQEFRVKEKKQRVAICQGTKNLKQSQLTLDLPELQSNKQIAYQKVHREREEIEPLVCERQHLNNPNLAKLSRYQRQRLIYGQLKKELIKLSCFDEDNLVTSQADRDQGSQANICSLQGENSYSIQDRKQSLLCKLNIFNQSVSFDDLKTKIETAIGQQQVTGERALEGRGRREQKIVEKFLAEVLKITDLKRLLRKKFSKELDWSPRMREMHQFYTYLEFNLENFRVNLAKNTHSNWQQLAFQGKQQHSHLHQLHITEDLGHYQGLDNAEITQFDHHKEIQCSMRYYGIEVKRQRQLQQFLQPAPELPSPLPDKIAQKSIKEIKQQDIASVRAT